MSLKSVVHELGIFGREIENKVMMIIEQSSLAKK
jgi:hypothetical protein